MLQEKTATSPTDLRDAWVKMEMQSRSQTKSPVERGAEWSAEFSNINAMHQMAQMSHNAPLSSPPMQQMNHFGGMQQQNCET